MGWVKVALLVVVLLCVTSSQGRRHRASYQGVLPPAPPGYMVKVVGSLDRHTHDPIVLYLPGMGDEYGPEEGLFQVKLFFFSLSFRSSP
jgi:hypothetical protein